MRLQPEIQGVTIVLRGNFNPANFQPSWFGSNGLIRPEEADKAVLQIIHPQVAIFQADWLEINCDRDRLQASTGQDSYYESVRDLVRGLLGLLSHTPLNAMGLNRQFHYPTVSEAIWHRIGHRLSPKVDWEGLLEEPGMRTLTVQGRRPDGLNGFIRATVEPSVKVTPGIYVAINDHFQLVEGEPSSMAVSAAVDILTQQWEASMERSRRVADHIANLEGDQ